MGEVASAFVTLIPSFKGGGGAIQKEIDGAAGAAGVSGGKKAGKGFGTGFVGGVGKLAGPLAAAFAVPAVIGGLNSLANKASDLNETVNKSSVIFGKNAGSIDKWAQGAATSMGLSRQAALEAAAGFGDMFTQIGFSGDQAAKMSKGVVQMSADLGSFNNLPTEDVSQRIAAAFRGEFDSLQALIPNINAARVEKEALAKTGKKNAKSLTAEEKAAAVLAIVNKDGARAMGDFAKTSDGAANKAKIQAARFEDLKTRAGGVLLPIKSLALDGFGRLITFGEKLGPVFSRVGGFFKPVIEGAKVFFSFLGGNDTGVDGPFREMAVAGEAARKVISDVVGGVKVFLSFLRGNDTGVDGPFRQMAVAGEAARRGITGIVAAIRGFITVALPIVQQFVAGMMARIQPLMPQIRTIFTTIGTIVTAALELVRAVIARVTTIISAIWSRWGTNIMDFIAKVFGAVLSIIGGVLKVVAGIIKTVTSLIKGDWSGAWNGIKQILAGVWQAIKGIVSGALTIIKATLSVAWTAIKAGVSAAWSGIKSAVSAGISGVVGFVKSLPGKITGALGNLGSLLYNAGKELLQGLINGISEKIQAVKNKVGEVAQAIKDFFPGSPVKRGPLTSWNNGGAGKRLGGMLAEGLAASRSQVTAASRGLAASVVSPDRLSSLSPGLTDGGGNVTVPLVVDGRVLAEVTFDRAGRVVDGGRVLAGLT